MSGTAERPTVVHVPSGVSLGEVCDRVTSDAIVSVARSESVIACRASIGGGLWPVPTGPLPVTPALPPVRLQATSGDVTVVDYLGDVDVIWKPVGGTEVHSIVRIGLGEVTAVSISPNRTQAIVGSSGGEVRIIELGRPDAAVVARWHSPDRSAVTNVGWSPKATVTTKSGLSWVIGDYDMCDTDEGLLALLRSRLPLCWNERQLHFIDSKTRRALGVAPCAPAPDLQASKLGT